MTNIANLLPNAKQTFYDANGVPLVGGKVYMYIPSTTTLKNTWQDSGETILNTNPIILDSLGSAVIYGQGLYRQLVKDSADNVIWDKLTGDPLYPLSVQTNSTTGGATLVAYLPPGASVAETVYAKLAQTISVKDFGATGDGSTDDITAINAAIASLSTTGGGIYFPQGTYRITAPITATNMAVALFGDGEKVAIIKVDATSNGINIIQNKQIYFTSISNLSIVTTQVNTSIAISIDYSSSATTGVIMDRCAIDNIEIYGSVPAFASGFQYGIVMDDCTNTRINQLTFIGYQSAVSQAGRTNAISAIKLMGANSPVETFISQCKIYFCQKAVEVIGTCEGIYIQQCAFVEVSNGVQWHEASGNAPELRVIGSHINCYSNAIYGLQIAQVSVNDNLLYKSNLATGTTAGIYMEQAIGGIITNNIFVNSGGAGDFDSIVMGTGSTDFIVSGNIFNGGITTAIWFQSGSSNNIATGNTFPGSYTTAYLDQGTHNAYGRRGVLAYITSDQAVANAITVSISFDAVKYDTDGFWSSGTNLTIPSGRGIKKIRLCGATMWAGNATGERVMTLTKGGTGQYVGSAGQYIPVGGYADPVRLSASGGIIDVNDGDVFTLEVFQSSGGSLNALALERTWLSIEVIE